MSVKAPVKTGSAAAILAITLAAAAVGCGRGPAPSAHDASARGAGHDVLTASVVLDSGGHAWQLTAGNAVLVSTDAGRQWRSVQLPGRPAIGHSVVVSGSTIAAVTVTSGGLAYQRSADGGATWSTIAVRTQTPTDQASVALSGDGQRVAVMAELPGSAGAGDLPELLIGPAGGPLTPVSAPVSGYIAWAGSQLVLTGGPLQSRLYTSGNQGVSWTQRAVDGTLAPRFNVPPDIAGFGVPLPGPGASVTVPVTEHRGGSTIVRLYRSPDAIRYTPGTSVALAGDIGAGVTALVSPAGTGRYVIATPGSTRLHLVSGHSVTTINPAGLAGAIDSLTFSDASNGLAETTGNSCAGKANCRSTVQLYRTSDGGRSWERAAA
ncbi:MAG TPA: hypothetical protein VGL63_03895 [Streptosporangiaceae bacterium]|jgi:hypothetical protein